MHANHYLAGLLAGFAGECVVVVPRVHGVDGHDGVVCVVASPNLGGCEAHGGLFVGLRIGVGDVEFLDNGVQVGSNLAVLAEDIAKLCHSQATVKIVVGRNGEGGFCPLSLAWRWEGSGTGLVCQR